MKSKGREVPFGLYLLIVGTMLAVKVFLARHLVLGHAFGMGSVADMLSVVAILSFAASLRGNLARRGLAVADIVISLLALFTVLYAAYFDQVPGAETIALTNQATSLGNEGLALIAWYHWIFVIDLPLIAWLGFKAGEREERRAGLGVVLGVSALMALFAFAVSALALPLAGNSMKSSYRYGLVAYQMSSMLPGKDEANAESLPGPAQMQKQIDALTGRNYSGREQNAPEHGQYAGKNVIMVQVEALQAGLVGARVDGQAVVPFLEQLIARSDYFPNTYSQIGRGNTSDAEFIANTSLYPASDQASAVKYAKKAIPSLPRLLADKGYTTFTFHTNDASFWNRFELYPALGFGMYYDRTFFGNEDVIGHGPSDEVLFRKTVQVLEQVQKQNKPFYAHIITVSSHYPFKPAAPRGYLRLSPEVMKTETGNYLQAESYTDMQIGNFIGELDTSGLLDNSILIVYGDHFGMRFEKATDEDRMLRMQVVGGNRLYNRADYYNIPLVIHLPGEDRSRLRSQVTGQIDIMPTIADLLGVDLSSTPHFGRSVYVKTPTMITRPSSIPTYIDDTEMYLGGVTDGEDRWYNSRNQLMLPTSKVPERLNNTTKLLRLSDNYATHLPKRDDATGRVGFIPNENEDVSKTPFR